MRNGGAYYTVQERFLWIFWRTEREFLTHGRDAISYKKTFATLPKAEKRVKILKSLDLLSVTKVETVYD